MLTYKTKLRLVAALGYRRALANELEAAIFTPAPLSEALKRNIVDAMARRAEANELINAVETAGTQVLSAKAQRRFVDMMARREEAEEILALI